MRTRDVHDEERERLIEKMLSARTPEEIEAVRKEVQAWLEKHPGDLAVLSAGEGLLMLEEALRLTRG